MFLHHSSEGGSIKHCAVAVAVVLNLLFSILFLVIVVFNGVRQTAFTNNLVKSPGSEVAPKAVVTLANIE